MPIKKKHMEKMGIHLAETFAFLLFIASSSLPLLRFLEEEGEDDEKESEPRIKAEIFFRNLRLK